MNNYYALIYLTNHLNFKCEGCRFLFSYSPHKNVWEAFLQKKDDTFRLIFSADSSETALFTDSFRNPKKANVTEFFNLLKENIIYKVELAKDDRWITLRFKNSHELLFKMFGNDPNVFLIKDEIIIESFKSSDKWLGQKKPHPRKSPPVPELNPKWSPKKIIISTDPKFPRHLISPIIQTHDLENKEPEQIRELTWCLSDQMKNDPVFRVLQDGNLCLINRENLLLPDLRVFDNCNDAIRFAYYKTSRERRLTKRIQSLKPRIEKALDKNKRSISQLEKADKAIERAENYKNYGHLLMAHAHQTLTHDEQSITVSNFYDNNNPIEIPVDPKHTIAENAQKYYERSDKAKKRIAESKRRLKELQQEYHQLKQIQDSLLKLEKIYEFDDWLDEHREQLNNLSVLSQSQKTEILPFRKSSVNGYEIWIGKNAKSNDELTTRAHKEDVWLHARGVSGSHVVIRMNNNKEFPPKEVILKAAASAAWNSKARGSKLAPVIYTKRKYVSKPKGSPPGAVRVHQEDVEIVEPKKLSEWTN